MEQLMGDTKDILPKMLLKESSDTPNTKSGGADPST
jgi:hypothetical protein